MNHPIYKKPTTQDELTLEWVRTHQELSTRPALVSYMVKNRTFRQTFFNCIEDLVKSYRLAFHEDTIYQHCYRRLRDNWQAKMESEAVAIWGELVGAWRNIRMNLDIAYHGMRKRPKNPHYVVGCRRKNV